jgi:hypothetical protein
MRAGPGDEPDGRFLRIRIDSDENLGLATEVQVPCIARTNKHTMWLRIASFAYIDRTKDFQLYEPCEIYQEASRSM